MINVSTVLIPMLLHSPDMIMVGLVNENRLPANLENTRMNKSLTNVNNLHCYQFKKK